MFHDQLHGARFGSDFFHLPQVNDESAVTTHNHGIGAQVTLHLLGGGAQHVVVYLPVAVTIDFHIVAHSFDIEEVRDIQIDRLAGRAHECDALWGQDCIC